MEAEERLGAEGCVYIKESCAEIEASWGGYMVRSLFGKWNGSAADGIQFTGEMHTDWEKVGSGLG